MSQQLPSPLNLDPKLIFDLAAKIDRPEVIAERYELDPAFLMEVMETPRVKALIREKQAELEKTGYSLAMKAKLCFEDLLGDVYVKAKRPDATLNSVLEAAKFMRTVAGLDKVDLGTAAKFSISINIGGQKTILSASSQDDVVDVDDVSLPPKPEFLAGIRTFGNPLAYVEQE